MRTLSIAIVLAACRSTPPAAPPTPVAPAPAVEIPEVVGIDGAVHDNGDSTEALPMVIALHGLGDNPESFVRALHDVEDVRVVALRGPHEWPRGSSWFEGSVRDMADADLLTALEVECRDLVPRIEAATARFPTVGTPIITGFSQGAVLSWAMPVLQPEAVGGAVPVAGFAPVSLAPTLSGTPPMRAFHGDADAVLPIDRAQAAYDAYAAVGVDITFTPFEGVGHRVPEEMLEAWHAAVAELIAQQAVEGGETSP